MTENQRIITQDQLVELVSRAGSLQSGDEQRKHLEDAVRQLTYEEYDVPADSNLTIQDAYDVAKELGVSDGYLKNAIQIYLPSKEEQISLLNGINARPSLRACWNNRQKDIDEYLSLLNRFHEIHPEEKCSVSDGYIPYEYGLNRLIEFREAKRDFFFPFFFLKNFYQKARLEFKPKHDYRNNETCNIDDFHKLPLELNITLYDSKFSNACGDLLAELNKKHIDKKNVHIKFDYIPK